MNKLSTSSTNEKIESSNDSLSILTEAENIILASNKEIKNRKNKALFTLEVVFFRPRTRKTPPKKIIINLVASNINALVFKAAATVPD